MQNVTEYYAQDHDRLDSLFKDFQVNKKTDFKKAKEAFVEFRSGLQRHIVWEEQILFPLFEQKNGMPKEMGPTAVMRKEHRMIGEALEGIHQRVKMGDSNSDAYETRLLEVLGQHNLKEEKILYPAIDQSLNPKECEKVFLEMEAITAQGPISCCEKC